MDKVLKIIIISSAIIIVPAIVYYCVYLPYNKGRELKKCLAVAENDFSMKVEAFNKAAESSRISAGSFELFNKDKENKKVDDDRCYNRYK